MNKIRFGILGTGRIAGLFAQAIIHASECASLTAVGSRTHETAVQFAQTYNVRHAYGSYDELINCADVDVVYIATPNTLHYENSMAALKAGKAVLCEKPLTMNAAEAKALIEYARSKKIFFCDAMWSRFFPAAIKIREWLPLIGDIRLVTANFAFQAQVNPASRLFAPELGGGSLLDLGVYNVAFATLAYSGEMPSDIKAAAYICETGVDGIASVSLKYDTGVASLNCGLILNMQRNAAIYGSLGSILIPDRFWAPEHVELNVYGKTTESFDCAKECNGMEYEVREVARCMNEDLIESPFMTHADSIIVMSILDEARRQIGLDYKLK